MNLKKGEIWTCIEPICKAEVEVIRGAQSTCHGKFTLRCCCGKEMVLKETVEHAEPEKVGAGAHSGTRR